MKKFFTYSSSIHSKKNASFPFCEIILVSKEEVPDGTPLFSSFEEAEKALLQHKTNFVKVEIILD